MKPNWILLVLAPFIFLVTSGQCADSANSSARKGGRRTRVMSAEKRLINALLRNYDAVGRSGRPVRNVSTPVTVYLSLGLIHMDLNEKAKMLTVSMWTRYQWRDEYLTWDPAHYDGVTAIRLDPTELWIPDIELYNAADANENKRHALAVISSDGTITWFPHTIFRSSCSVDVSNYPFDSQNCHLWFGSWTHTSREINLTNGYDEGIDLSTFKDDYKESCAWHVLNVTARRKAMPSENEDPHYIVLTFDLYLERKIVFSSIILTLPCIFFAFLTLVVFWLPPDRPDRTGLAMSTFSSFMLLLLILVETAPPTASSVPMLGVYYCYNMVIIMISIILSSMVVNISRGDTKQLPKWFLHLLHWCHNCRKVKVKDRMKMPKSCLGRGDDAMMKMLSSGSPSPDIVKERQNEQKRSVTCADSISHLGSSFRDDNGSHMSIEKQLNDIRCIITRLEIATRENHHTENASKKIRSEWKSFATFLDRIFFVVYLFLIILSLVFIFPKPHSWALF